MSNKNCKSCGSAIKSTKQKVQKPIEKPAAIRIEKQKAKMLSS